MRSSGICGVCDSTTAGEAAHEFLAPHILWGSEGGQEFIDRAEVAAAKMGCLIDSMVASFSVGSAFRYTSVVLHLCVAKP